MVSVGSVVVLGSADTGVVLLGSVVLGVVVSGLGVLGVVVLGVMVSGSVVAGPSRTRATVGSSGGATAVLMTELMANQGPGGIVLVEGRVQADRIEQWILRS